MSDSSLWSGLGARAPAPSPAGFSSLGGSDEQDPDFDRPSIKRVVDAATAPSPLPANPFAQTYRPAAGSADTSADDSPADKLLEEKIMQPKRAAPAGPVVRNLQLRLCAVLADASKPLTRSELAKLLPDLETKQLSQTLFQVTGNSRVERTNGNTFRLTATGRAYLKGQPGDAAPKPAAAPAAPPPATSKARRSIEVRRAPSPITAITVRDAQPQLLQERSFRCAVISDGGFFLAKNGLQIDLTPSEHAEMLRYLDRMAEQPAA